MGFRFRRKLRIFPGLYLNLSKSGVSTSIGGRGATLNLSKRGTRTTICPARDFRGGRRRSLGRKVPRSTPRPARSLNCIARMVERAGGSCAGSCFWPSARLFSGPPVGSKPEARKLAEGGHLKELESSHAARSTPAAKPVRSSSDAVSSGRHTARSPFRTFLGSLSIERGFKFVCCFSGLRGRSGEI